MKKDEKISRDLHNLITFAMPSDGMDINVDLLGDINNLEVRMTAISTCLFRTLTDLGFNAEKLFKQAWLTDVIKNESPEDYKILKNLIKTLTEKIDGGNKNEECN